MAILTSQQVSDLAKDFLGLARTITDFRFNNWNSLSKTENQELYNLQLSVLNLGEDVLALSAVLVLDEVQTSLEQIKDITSQIKDTFKTLRDIQKGINIATTVVTLGKAIVNKNPTEINNAIDGIVGALKP